MAQIESRIRVFIAPGEVLPSAFRWSGRTLRVLSAHPVGVRGSERRYRLSTAQGAYELAVEIGTGAWHMRRAPGWFSRLWTGIQRAPRYPLPSSRRRKRVSACAAPAGQPARLVAVTERAA